MDLLVTVSFQSVPGELDIEYSSDGMVSYFPDNRVPKDMKKLFLLAEQRAADFLPGITAPVPSLDSFVFDEKLIDSREKVIIARRFVSFLCGLFFSLSAMGIEKREVLAEWIKIGDWEPVPFLGEGLLL